MAVRVRNAEADRAYRKRNRERLREYNRQWHRRNPAKNKEYAAKYYARDPEKMASQQRRKRARNPEKYSLISLNSRYKRKYGMTYANKASMLDAQGGCAICGGQEPGSKRGWDTDHIAGTKIVRGILCHPCNIMVHKHATPAKLRAAAAYLEKSHDSPL